MTDGEVGGWMRAAGQASRKVKIRNGMWYLHVCTLDQVISRKIINVTAAKR